MRHRPWTMLLPLLMFVACDRALVPAASDDAAASPIPIDEPLPEVPDALREACPQVEETLIAENIAAMQRDKDVGFTKQDMLVASQLGCVRAAETEDDFAVCTACIQAIADHVYP